MTMGRGFVTSLDGDVGGHERCRGTLRGGFARSDAPVGVAGTRQTVLRPRSRSPRSAAVRSLVCVTISRVLRQFQRRRPSWLPSEARNSIAPDQSVRALTLVVAGRRRSTTAHYSSPPRTWASRICQCRRSSGRPGPRRQSGRPSGRRPIGFPRRQTGRRRPSLGVASGTRRQDRDSTWSPGRARLALGPRRAISIARNVLPVRPRRRREFSGCSSMRSSWLYWSSVRRSITERARPPGRRVTGTRSNSGRSRSRTSRDEIVGGVLPHV